MTARPFGGARVVAVVTIDDPDVAEPVGEALTSGGLWAAEVTFRSAAAEEALRRMSASSQLLVGAGTVVSARQVDLAVDAGAQFIVSPGLNNKVVERATERGVPVYPGVATATEVIAALDLGLNCLKLFPAEPLGGVAMVKALSAAFPAVSFVPTGGISAASLRNYLALPSVAAVGGSWMVSPNLLLNRRFQDVARLAAETVALSGDELWRSK